LIITGIGLNKQRLEVGYEFIISDINTRILVEHLKTGNLASGVVELRSNAFLYKAKYYLQPSDGNLRQDICHY
jgi:hypothetical protein